MGRAGDRPVAGDWDANGTATLGLFRPSDVAFWLRANNAEAPEVGKVPFGAESDLPVVGNWDGK